MPRLVLVLAICIAGALSYLGMERLLYASENRARVYFYYNEHLRPIACQIDGNPLDTTLRELLRGPDAAARAKNIQTMLPADLQILDRRVENGVLILTFNDALLKLSGGHQAIDSALKQIVFTATQIKGIKAVSFRIQDFAGQTLVIGGEGYIIDRPLDRAYFKGAR
ncbi:MAG: GerMN domain-containing protein [Candidatus Margulisbacteria bacterium]|jgi:spore germination protein GerM|nr:GerMN domain-containing protein [Candidatus Margulisiibacteriota bacterium]